MEELQVAGPAPGNIACIVYARPTRVFCSPAGQWSGERNESSMYHFWLDACALKVGSRFLSLQILASHAVQQVPATIHTRRHTRTFFRKPEPGLRHRCLGGDDVALPVWLKNWFSEHPQSQPLELILPAGLAAVLMKGGWQQICLPDVEPWVVGWRVLQMLWPSLDPCVDLNWDPPCTPFDLADTRCFCRVHQFLRTPSDA